MPAEEGPETPAGEVTIGSEARPAYQPIIIDLSAGGFLVSADEERTQDELFVIDPSYDGEFSLAGVICQLIRSEDRGEGRYLHHLEFTNVNDTLQDRLVRQIHRTQVKQSRG